MTQEIDQEYLQGALVQAADGEAKWVKELLAAGADPNGLPLIMAIQCDEPEIIHMMIAAGADVNLDFKGTTPLIRAIQCVSVEIVQILIESGADISRANVNGVTPIQVVKLENRKNTTEHERERIIHLLKAAGVVE
jgi:ankyrin repeat protein